MHKNFSLDTKYCLFAIEKVYFGPNQRSFGQSQGHRENDHKINWSKDVEDIQTMNDGK
jgi:hypothetical protein